jgi:hypothetical protein
VYRGFIIAHPRRFVKGIAPFSQNRSSLRAFTGQAPHNGSRIVSEDGSMARGGQICYDEKRTDTPPAFSAIPGRIPSSAIFHEKNAQTVDNEEKIWYDKLKSHVLRS